MAAKSKTAKITASTVAPTVPTASASIITFVKGPLKSYRPTSRRGKVWEFVQAQCVGQTYAAACKLLETKCPSMYTHGSATKPPKLESSSLWLGWFAGTSAKQGGGLIKW